MGKQRERLGFDTGMTAVMTLVACASLTVVVVVIAGGRTWTVLAIAPASIAVQAAYWLIQPRNRHR